MACPRRRYITWEEGKIIENVSDHDCVAGASTEAGVAPGVRMERIESFADITFANLMHMAGGWFQMYAFTLTKTDDDRTLLEHVHAGWPGTHGNFRKCNTTWGVLLHHLRDYAETGNPAPAFE